MRIAIDAINLRGRGGTVTHLIELLRNADPHRHGFTQIMVFGGTETLSQLPKRNWIRETNHPWMDDLLPKRAIWQHRQLTKIVQEKCSILFVPGSTYLGNFHPFITMFRNMLPFDPDESRRYGISLDRARLFLLHRTQSATFKRTDGLIFLSDYARSVIRKFNLSVVENSVVIPHGIDRRFFKKPRKQRETDSFSDYKPIRLLYVSHISVYKHQWNVVKAVGQLKQMGVPVNLQLIGRAHPSALKKLRAAIVQVDPDSDFITYRGYVNRQELIAYYHDADAFVYASSCENLPNILLEAMAAGLPIACSHHEPMPTILGNAGEYFDPEQPTDIATAIFNLLHSVSIRERNSSLAYENASAYSWSRCADDTFMYLKKIHDIYYSSYH